MNMMRSDLNQLQLDAQMIESSKVIDGYVYLSEEIAEKKEREEQRKRKTVLLGLLLVSSVVFLWDNQFFVSTPQNLEAFHPAPALGQVLSDGVVEHLQPETAASVSTSQLELGDGIPDDIIKFIDADISAEKKVEVSKVVALEEITESPKNTFNIDRVLASGDKLFKRDRLMSPPEHNAFVRYEKVLSVYPDNPRALEGIKKIVDRYVYFAESVIAKNEEYKVPDLIKKAYQAGEKYMDVSVIIQKFSDYLSDDSVFIDAAELKAEADSNEQHVDRGLSQENSDGEKFHGNTVFSADRRIAKTAYEMYIKGDISSAETILKNFTKLSGFWGESNDLLLKMYLGEKKVAEAENLIYENKALDAYQFAEKAARIMMVRGDSFGALEMLSSYRPEFLENKSYYVLLASLYHKVGNYQRSVYWYRQLLSVDHNDARLWLGLAVSLDALDNVDDALKAFDYVRLYAQRDSSIRNYINERKLALVDL